MATIAKSMVDTIYGNWNVGLGGARPTIRQLMSDKAELAPTTEQVIVRVPWQEDSKPINDTYSNIKYTLTIRIKTTTDEDRLKEIKDEVVRIILTNAIAGIDRQSVGAGENRSDKSRGIFIHELRAICEDFVSTGGSSYSGTTTGDVTVSGDLDVTGDASVGGDLAVSLSANIVGDLAVQNDITAKKNLTIFNTGAGGAAQSPNLASSDAAKVLALTGSFEISDNLTTGGTLTTATQAQIDDLLMFGSANAAYVPMIIVGGDNIASYRVVLGLVLNRGVDDFSTTWALPKPTNKGGLKLYLSDLKYAAQDADVDDYIDLVTIYGLNGTTKTSLDTDGTNHTTAGDKTFAGAVFPAAVLDVSSYQNVWIQIAHRATGANQNAMTNVRMECYYAA